MLLVIDVPAEVAHRLQHDWPVRRGAVDGAQHPVDVAVLGTQLIHRTGQTALGAERGEEPGLLG
jgi:hypothetical protein